MFSQLTTPHLQLGTARWVCLFVAVDSQWSCSPLVSLETHQTGATEQNRNRWMLSGPPRPSSPAEREALRRGAVGTGLFPWPRPAARSRRAAEAGVGRPLFRTPRNGRNVLRFFGPKTNHQKGGPQIMSCNGVFLLASLYRPHKKSFFSKNRETHSVFLNPECGGRGNHLNLAVGETEASDFRGFPCWRHARYGF